MPTLSHARPTAWARREERLCPPYDSLTLSGGDLEFVVREDVILFGLRLVAHEAAVEVGGGIWRLVGAEDLVLPLAIASNKLYHQKRVVRSVSHFPYNKFSGSDHRISAG